MIGRTEETESLRVLLEDETRNRVESTTLARSGSDPRALAVRARDGDVRAFEALYRTHRARVFGVCRRMAQGGDEAEGWSQDVWVRVWERIGSFRGESDFSTWLHRLAVNLILDRIRSAARHREWLQEVAVDTRAAGPVRGMGREERVDLERAVDALPDGARTIFLLHDVEGYKHREIADRLGVAEGTVKAQLHRARRLLREALEP
jgi:RNA polymerase sigma-70 factor (ECF subfamily)